ncbi:AraC family transcriptional regulator [Pedobacter hiemivivus]|uniref:Helix-turn-helix domain-containing protein n=1 Tax=Pedobacter hiemivivus TaxID=2530454 RepID=A0A4R0NK00_9SPHI|nr:helix-turn-helix domain-containing protein [Pedobacter hiemivivus]TCC99643.1 helix-turn-helix domain-containing protein [Pedobacter hiemivivus]
MTKKTEIPVFTAQSYRNAYFQGTEESKRQAAIRASVAHFEIHRRDDFRFKCKETIASNRLDFHLVFIVTGGEGIHTFGDKEYYLRPGMLCFVSPGLITSWQTTVDDHAGYFCAFTSDFFQKGLKDQEVLANYPFFHDDGSAVLNLNEPQTEYFNRLFVEIEEEYNSDNTYKADLIRALLNVLFQKAIKSVDTDKGGCLVDAGNAAQRITKDFIRLYQKDFLPLIDQEVSTVKSLADYAAALAVTQNHLNDSVKSVTGKTPGELIRERTLKEATQLLTYTSLSISEIAFLLQFEDPSYFARFFRKYTGLSPKEQRQNVSSV